MSATFPHVLIFDRLHRKGQRCKILRFTGGIKVQVEFTDGYKAIVDRAALRRVASNEVEKKEVQP